MKNFASSRNAIILISIIALFAALSVFLTSRIVPLGQWGKSFPVYGDSTIMGYIACWGAHAIFHSPFSYYDPPIFFPLRNMLPSTDGLELPVLMIFPVWYLTKNPCYVINGMVCLSFFTSFLCTYFCGRRVFQWRRDIAVFAAIAFTVCSDRFFHALGHYNLIWVGIFPLVFAACWSLLEAPTKRNAVIFGAVMGCSIYLSFYFLVLSGFLVFLTALIWMTSRWKILSFYHFITLILSFCVCLFMIAPKAVVYYNASKRSSQQRNDINHAGYKEHAATFDGWLKPMNTHQMQSYWYNLFPMKPSKQFPDENDQFVGYMLLFCLSLESIRLLCRGVSRKWDQDDRFSLACIIASGFVFSISFGPHFSLYGVSPYRIVYHGYLKYSGFFRVPARFAFIFQLLAVFPVGVFFHSVLKKNNQPLLGILLTTYISFLIIVEQIPGSLYKTSLTTYHKLAIWDELNKAEPSKKEPYIDLSNSLFLNSSLAGMGFDRRTVNGWEGASLGKEFDKTVTLMKDFPSTASLSWLAVNAIPWIIIPDSSYVSLAERNPNLKKYAKADNHSLFHIENINDLTNDYFKDYLRILEIIKKDFKGGFPVVSYPQGNEAVYINLAGVELLDSEGFFDFKESLERNYFQTFLSPNSDILAGKYKAVNLEYEISNGNDEPDHAIQLYWGGEGKSLSEERTLQGRIQQVDKSDTKKFKAQFDLLNNRNWFETEFLNLLRIDFHTFKSVPTQMKIKIIRVQLIPIASPDELAPLPQIKS